MEKKRHTTASGEDYLEAILVLQKKMGMVRSVDVARHLDVSKPSVCPCGSNTAGGRLSDDGRRQFPALNGCWLRSCGAGL